MERKMVKQVVTAVKCHSCSRVCGEIEGRPAVWALLQVERIFPVIGCSVRSSWDVRFSRCGGRVYPDESYTGGRPGTRYATPL